MSDERLYSGKASEAFWQRIKRIEDEAAHDVAYSAGVMLQNIEETCLRIIADAEKRGRRVRRKK